MPKLSEHAKRIGKKIGLNDDKGYGVAVFLALIVTAIVITGFFVNDYISGNPSGYNTIYLLDASQKAIDYPQILIAGKNSTFNVYVTVENHNGATADYQIQIKITKNLSSYPLNGTQPTQVLETGNIAGNGGKWQSITNITETEIGAYAVVFELYQHNGNGLDFTYNYCVLNIEVLNK